MYKSHCYNDFNEVSLDNITSLSIRLIFKKKLGLAQKTDKKNYDIAVFLLTFFKLDRT